MMNISSYTFWHQSVNLRDSTKTKENRSDTPVQVLISLTIIIRILKYYIIILNIRKCTNMRFLYVETPVGNPEKVTAEAQTERKY
jgi:hypothetical protein